MDNKLSLNSFNKHTHLKIYYFYNDVRENIHSLIRKYTITIIYNIK